MRYPFTILLAVLLPACAALDEKLPAPPTTTEVVQMAKTGQAAEAIIERMRASRAVYRLSASQLADLRAQGVPDKVIDYMQRTYLDDVRHREWAYARDAYFYPPFYGPYYSPFIGPYRPYWRRPYWR